MAHALDVAQRSWPGEPRAKLLLRLVHAGLVVLEHGADDEARRRRAAVDASSGKYVDAFSVDFLERPRQDWPE